VEKGANPYPSPRTRRVTKFIKMYERKFKDSGGHIGLRQKNDLLRVYTDEQFRFIHEYLINRGKELDYRLKVDLNMGHFFCLRSKNRLVAELADLFTIPQPGEGIDESPVPMLFLLLCQGKVFVYFLLAMQHADHSIC